MFLMFIGNEFHEIAPWYKAMFLYFSQISMAVLKSGAALDLTFLYPVILPFLCFYTNNSIYMYTCVMFYGLTFPIGCLEEKFKLENPGIDPGTSHMLSERSTI